MKAIFAKWRTRAAAEDGATATIVAISLTMMLTFMAFVADLGLAYVKTAQVQTAADAAVMAAGLSLPVACDDTVKQTAMRSTALEYLAKNGIASDGVSITFTHESGDNYTGIEVTVPASSETGFARIIGVDEITFRRTAEARTVPTASLSDLVPLSVQQETLDALLAAGTTEHIVLKYGKKTGDVVQGAFGALDLDGVNGGGANDYCSWLSYGYSGKLSIGDSLPVETGNMSGPTLTGVTQRYNACTHFASDGGCTKDHYVAGCPRVMKVPVVIYTSSKQVRIVGFAAFVLEDYTTYASKGYVVGSYVDMVNIGSYYGDLTGTADSYGVYSLTLSK